MGTLRRDLGALAGTDFDLVVVGGGVHGASIAWRAAQHGVRVALVERDDFGGATSANSLKVLHGGLRHLQRGDLRALRRAILTRRRWFRMAPGFLRPLAFVSPTRGWGRHSRGAFAAALRLNDLVGADRNAEVRAVGRLGRSRLLSRDELCRRLGADPGEAVNGGALWYDGLIVEPERMTLAFVATAVAHGACAVNYVRATDLVLRGGRVAAVRATDGESGDAFEIRTRCVVDAAGPWSAALRAGSASGTSAAGSGGWVKALNIVLGRNLFPELAVGLTVPDAEHGRPALGGRGTRLVFFVPWRGRTMIGTSYRAVDRVEAHCAAGEREVAALVAAANAAWPSADIDPGEVVFTHAGYLPAQAPGGGGSASLVGRPRIAARAAGSVVEVTGVKYTGAIEVADAVVARVLTALGRPRGALHADGALCFGADPGTEWPAGGSIPGAALFSVAQRAHLVQNYGKAAADVCALALAEADLARPVADGMPNSRAEVVHAARAEMALHLDDVVFRRLGVGGAGHPGATVLARCARLMGEELGWGAGRERAELERVDDAYRRCGVPHGA